MGLTVYGGGGKPEEEKTVTAGTSVIEVLPSSGKVMKKVTVNPTPTESKSVTPTTSELTVTPSEGKHLSQVIVGAIEDVTPEVNAQTPVITQVLEGLVGKAQGANATADKILEGYSAYVGQVLLEGTAKEGVNLSDIGITKYAIDGFTFSSDTLASTSVNHSLGEVPKIAFVFTNDAVSHSSGANRVVQAVYVSKIGSGELNLQWDEEIYWNDGSRISQTNRMTITESSFAINGGNSCKYQSGVNYTLITMA